MSQLVFSFIMIFAIGFLNTAKAQTPQVETSEETELDPYSPDVEDILKNFDDAYEKQTGLSPFLDSARIFNIINGSCFRESCPVWAQVVKSQQKMYLYVNAELVNTFFVSTGKNNRTPNFDTHPNGRIYDEYNSKIFPGGTYRGLGNMPFAVFIEGGIAIHGTLEGNFKYLGQPVSHGCIRLHPTNAYIFNRLVREHGIHNVWITVQE